MILLEQSSCGPWHSCHNAQISLQEDNSPSENNLGCSSNHEQIGEKSMAAQHSLILTLKCTCQNVR